MKLAHENKIISPHLQAFSRARPASSIVKTPRRRRQEGVVPLRLLKISTTLSSSSPTLSTPTSSTTISTHVFFMNTSSW